MTMRTLHRLLGTLLIAAMGLAVGGCASGSTGLLPNPQKELRKNRKEYTADAAKRAYPTTAPQAGKSMVRGEVDYQLNVINLVNLGEKDLENVEVWVNGQYVVGLAKLPAKRQVGINFNALYDNEGRQSPQKGVWVEKVELLVDGQVYSTTLHAAD